MTRWILELEVVFVRTGILDGSLKDCILVVSELCHKSVGGEVSGKLRATPSMPYLQHLLILPLQRALCLWYVTNALFCWPGPR